MNFNQGKLVDQIFKTYNLGFKMLKSSRTNESRLGIQRHILSQCSTKSRYRYKFLPNYSKDDDPDRHVSPNV
jgi:hypothetical protein